ncbi:hypothetical protein [Arachidicoccus terrestris]|uniref:hypothetical protein n=1 Tax=Arachidicoccus terrestris TaxID=2875539 RepID=UPI001CC4DCFC|nr:hypothetical protein [Arachidicoccus terrestris]UAY55499.1 hypothetical protein K9M52_00220 [Arachidicoccus terrestris]
MGLVLAGRLGGAFLLKRIKPSVVLLISSAGGAMMLVVVAILTGGSIFLFSDRRALHISDVSGHIHAKY